MALPRAEVSAGLLAELDDFEALLRSIDDDARSTPTRCGEWDVGDVASHTIGSLADVVAGRLDGLGSPEVTEREVTERRGRSLAELADECAAVREAAAGLLAVFDDDAWSAGAPGGYEGTLGDGVEALWYDTYLHADDIRSGLGQPSVPGDGLRAAASHLSVELTKRGWGPATLALVGLPEFPVSGGGGRRIGGDPLAFTLVATGRADPATLDLDPGVNVYA
ncbi:MAG: maleylpyruvate isomerase family mycothiol-dependent enzyme [Acidimicrobiia bacterium]|nr:maleylpyruvate isomerase family mycothiol-dependent enzyme [Acidimicrobiia bacterium]